MSELAFNLNGEPFELPAAAVGWRVRRIKGRGAPEVVYSREGVPLILPIDAEIDDLRQAARGEGKFRLDPVDEHNRMFPQGPAGYVCVQPSENATELAPLVSRTPTDNVAIEAMRMNTELARTIIDRFPMMMDSAAALLRAADGAGLPAREPRAIVESHDRGEDDRDDPEEEDDQDEDPAEEAAPRAAGLVGLLETLAPFVMPAIMSAIAGGKLKIPGGIGALLDCRRASPKGRSHADAPAPHATSTPGSGPAPGPRDPAPAPAGTTSTRPAGPRDPARSSGGSSSPRSPARPAAAPTASDGSPVPGAPLREDAMGTSDKGSPHVARPADPAVGDVSRVAASIRHEATVAGGDTPTSRSHIDIAPAGAANHVEPEVAAESATESTDELPMLDAAALAHFAAIQGALTFREGMLARALAAELTPAELRSWLTELRQLSVAEAADRIRSVLGDEAADDTSGGGS